MNVIMLFALRWFLCLLFPSCPSISYSVVDFRSNLSIHIFSQNFVSIFLANHLFTFSFTFQSIKDLLVITKRLDLCCFRQAVQCWHGDDGGGREGGMKHIAVNYTVEVFEFPHLGCHHLDIVNNSTVQLTQCNGVGIFWHVPHPSINWVSPLQFTTDFKCFARNLVSLSNLSGMSDTFRNQVFH